MIIRNLMNGNKLYQNGLKSLIMKSSCYSTESLATVTLKKKESPIFKLCASVCIERMPIITCDMDKLEKRYSNLINDLNIKKSLLSDHELRHLKDIEIVNKRKQAGNENNEQEIVIETALDYEDKCLKQLQSFNFAERKTFEKNLDENKKPALRTLDRVLDKKLILIVYDNEKSVWHLPKLEWNNTIDSSLRNTAERSINDLNSNLKVEFLGNAPVALFKVKKDDKIISEKHYIFKAQYKTGAELLAFQTKFDHAWVRKEELADFIKNKDYLECLNSFILDF